MGPNFRLIFVLVTLLGRRGLTQYLGEEELDPLQQTAVIDGKVRELDKIGPSMYTNRSTTTLNCASGYMNVVVNFLEPFYGIVYPNASSRTQACLVHGDGSTQLTINLPLRGCGTNRVDRRVFVNNIIVRFHKGLELEIDEVKTIICRYPSPEVLLPPPGPPVPIVQPKAPIPPQGIGEMEILMILCAILFLALTIIGMACSYLGLKKRNIRIVRHRQIAAPPSEISSVYSDGFAQSESEIICPQVMVKPPQPSFVVRVKKAMTPPRTPEPDYPIQSALSQSLTTILENEGSLHGSRPDSEHAAIISESEDDGYPPPILQPPPGFSEVSVVQRPPVIDVKHIESVKIVQQKITDVEETIERGKMKYIAAIEPPEPESDYSSDVRSVTELIQEQPDISSHMVDDRYMTTTKETHVTEDIEKRHRFTKHHQMKPKPLPPPKWDVAIRHYPGPKYADDLESSGPEWEAVSEPGSDVFRAQMMDGIDDRLSQIDVEIMEHPPPSNWKVLLRVLEPPITEEATTEYLTVEDREKWRQIITTESTLRTMLSTATVREDYEVIRKDFRYEKLFEPTKWDVIIRILSPPYEPSRPGDETSSEAPSMSDTDSISSFKDGRRYKRSDLPGAMAVRKISLPPLHEYSTDGTTVVKETSGTSTTRSKASKTSVFSGEVRSRAETEVNFSRVHVDTWSGVSGSSSPVRPTPHSEITFGPTTLYEDEYPDTDMDDRLSGRTARSLVRSASEFTEDWRHPDHVDRYSESSAGSKPHRQRERSTSEYFEEVPHLSDFPTSPDQSPESSPQMGIRRRPLFEIETHPFRASDGTTYHHESQIMNQGEQRRERVVERQVTSTHVHSSSRQQSDDKDAISKF